MSDEVVELLGSDRDYERIQTQYAKRLAPIHPTRADIAHLLMEMIRKGQIYIMDKEHSIPMSASGIVGYDGDKIIIFCER